MERSLKDLISRLPIPGLKESANRHIIADALSHILSIPIKPSQIIFKDEIVTVSVPPIVKSMLKIKQMQIIENLQKEGIQVNSVR